MANRSGRGLGKPDGCPGHNSPLNRVGLNPRKPSRPAVMCTASTGRTQDCTRPQRQSFKKFLHPGSHPHKTAIFATLVNTQQIWRFHTRWTRLGHPKPSKIGRERGVHDPHGTSDRQQRDSLSICLPFYSRPASTGLGCRQICGFAVFPYDRLQRASISAKNGGSSR